MSSVTQVFQLLLSVSLCISACFFSDRLRSFCPDHTEHKVSENHTARGQRQKRLLLYTYISTLERGLRRKHASMEFQKKHSEVTYDWTTIRNEIFSEQQ